MKTTILSSVIAIGIFAGGCFIASQLTGCASTGGLTPQAHSALTATAAILVDAAEAYQSAGEPGLPAKDQALFNGLSSAAAQLQAQVGQSANPAAINTGVPAVNSAITKNVTTGAVVTQADVDTVSNAAALVGNDE